MRQNRSAQNQVSRNKHSFRPTGEPSLGGVLARKREGALRADQATNLAHLFHLVQDHSQLGYMRWAVDVHRYSNSRHSKSSRESPPTTSTLRPKDEQGSIRSKKRRAWSVLILIYVGSSLLAGKRRSCSAGCRANADGSGGRRAKRTPMLQCPSHPSPHRIELTGRPHRWNLPTGLS